MGWEVARKAPILAFESAEGIHPATTHSGLPPKGNMKPESLDGGNKKNAIHIAL